MLTIRACTNNLGGIAECADLQKCLWRCCVPPCCLPRAARKRKKAPSRLWRIPQHLHLPHPLHREDILLPAPLRRLQMPRALGASRPIYPPQAPALSARRPRTAGQRPAARVHCPLLPRIHSKRRPHRMAPMPRRCGPTAVCACVPRQGRMGKSY